MKEECYLLVEDETFLVPGLDAAWSVRRRPRWYVKMLASIIDLREMIVWN